MNDNHLPSIADERLLAAMQAVNPPLEKLMADRLALRQEMRQAKDELEFVRYQMIPRYIGFVKAIALGAASLALIAMALALFKGLFEVKTTTILFASLAAGLDRGSSRSQIWPMAGPSKWSHRVYGKGVT
jgi:hypothetical protein